MTTTGPVLSQSGQLQERGTNSRARTWTLRFLWMLPHKWQKPIDLAILFPPATLTRSWIENTVTVGALIQDVYGPCGVMTHCATKTSPKYSVMIMPTVLLIFILYPLHFMVFHTTKCSLNTYYMPRRVELTVIHMLALIEFLIMSGNVTIFKKKNTRPVLHAL